MSFHVDTARHPDTWFPNLRLEGGGGGRGNREEQACGRFCQKEQVPDSDKPSGWNRWQMKTFPHCPVPTAKLLPVQCDSGPERAAVGWMKTQLLTQKDIQRCVGVLPSSLPLRSKYGPREPLLRSTDRAKVMMQISEPSRNFWMFSPRTKFKATFRSTKFYENAFSPPRTAGLQVEGQYLPQRWAQDSLCSVSTPSSWTWSQLTNGHPLCHWYPESGPSSYPEARWRWSRAWAWTRNPALASALWATARQYPCL